MAALFRVVALVAKLGTSLRSGQRPVMTPGLSRTRRWVMRRLACVIAALAAMLLTAGPGSAGPAAASGQPFTLPMGLGSGQFNGYIGGLAECVVHGAV